MKKIIACALALALILSLCACGAAPAETPVPAEVTPAPEAAAAPVPEEDVYILFTNDVHCGVDEGMGYTGVGTVRQTLLAAGHSVLLADVGDCLQGDLMGTLSQGEYIIELMEQAGYDVATPGNHEFDYGMERFLSLAEGSSFPWVSANFRASDGELVFPGYVMKEAAGAKIAFVGISTPQTITTSTPKYFMNEDGEFIYSFDSDETGETLYASVQTAVDAARAEGADYVVALAHLGTILAASPWTSGEVINHTTGIDAMLDGHSHTVLEEEWVKNAEGKEVLLTSGGTKLENIGCLRISAEGKLSSMFMTDGGMGAAVAEEQAKLDDRVSETVGYTDVALCITDPATGMRMVRSNETNLGDLAADAYRTAGDAQIALVNAGSIRTDVEPGEISFGDVVAIHPFGNVACVIEATGQQILDALEAGASALPGELGGFLQVSGLSYTVDLSVESTVVRDADNMFLRVDGARRVKDVMVGDAPLDPEAVYTVAGTTYILHNMGDGFSMFADCPLLIPELRIDNQTLIDYIQGTLNGVIGEEYADPYGQGRITILPAR